MSRRYDELRGRIDPDASPEVRRRHVVDLVWDHHHSTGVSWVGFYLPDEAQLVLAERRDAPACSPIGLEGMCGLCFREAKAYVVDDVRSLGESYIACDPRDQSEVVVPCMRDGRVVGVLDLDSHEVGAFDESDAIELHRLLAEAGLTDAREVAVERR